MTLPKEVSLLAEGHREDAKGAIHGTVKSALEGAFAGLHSAVAAIHTRNQVGKIHYHVDVLVAKFAQNLSTGRTVSLNSTASRNGPARVRDLKLGWQEGMEREFRERLRLGIEQETSRSLVSFAMPDGEHLESFNRDTRRVIEKGLCPTYKETTPKDHEIVRHFRWSAMDDRIFKIASGGQGESGTSVLLGVTAFG